MRLLTLVAALALLVSGCSTASSSTPSQSAGGTAIRVQTFPGAYSSMPVHVASEMGIFAKHGLNAQLVDVQSSSAGIAAMLGGSIDFVESGADLVLANRDKGTDIQYVSANEDRNYTTLIVSNKVQLPHLSQGYPAVMADLKGLRIGVNAIGATLYLAAVMMLSDAGLSKDDVKFVATGTGATTLAAWKAGTVDAQVTFAPVPEMVEALGLGKVVFTLSEQGPEVLRFQGLYSGWVAQTSYIKSHKGAVDAFIKSIQDAIAWIRDPTNNAKLLALAKKYAGVQNVAGIDEDAVLSKMISNYRLYWGAAISREAIDQWNDYALRNNLIKKHVPYEQVVYAGAPTCTNKCQ